MAGNNITLLSEVGRELLPAEADANIKELDTRTGAGWKDLVGAVQTLGIPDENMPTVKKFGSSGLRKEFSFGVDDYVFAQAFHINHDVKVGGKAYIHVHWSTSGDDENTVKWEFQISRAKGHDQEYFSAESKYYVEQVPNGAWRHLIAEVGDDDAIILTEPDELFLVTIRRITNGGTDNEDDVFCLGCDFHYEANRDSTPQKTPDFYVKN